jgi:hypothetical protein
MRDPNCLERFGIPVVEFKKQKPKIEENWWQQLKMFFYQE